MTTKQLIEVRTSRTAQHRRPARRHGQMASAHTELSWVKREHGNSEFGKFAANHFQELIAKLSVELAI